LRYANVTHSTQLSFIIDRTAGHSHLQQLYCVQVSNARCELQKAIDACHFAPTAKYLRQAAAACLLHGLQSVQPDSKSHIRFTVQYVKLSQVAEHVRQMCPDIDNLLERLQGRTGSKYFVLNMEEPACVLVRLHDLIHPPYQRNVRDLLATIRRPAPLAAQSSSIVVAPNVRVVPRPIRPDSGSSCASAAYIGADDDVSVLLLTCTALNNLLSHAWLWHGLTDSLWCQVLCLSNIFFSVLGCDEFCHAATTLHLHSISSY